MKTSRIETKHLLLLWRRGERFPSEYGGSQEYFSIPPPITSVRSYMSRPLGVPLNNISVLLFIIVKTSNNHLFTL
uniref:Uncharacterized protein n=1 Tax=Xenopus tropicalis TaxID=8364 RepID=A0A1B8XVR6_XENTR